MKHIVMASVTKPSRPDRRQASASCTNHRPAVIYATLFAYSKVILSQDTSVSISDGTELRADLEGLTTWRNESKCELIDRNTFRNHAEAEKVVFEYIEGFYNTHRRHSSIGHLSPANYERKMYEKEKISNH